MSDLEQLLRRIIREEVDAALQAWRDGAEMLHAIGPVPQQLDLSGPPAPGVSLWEPIESAKVPGTGTRSYEIRKGYPCKVRGEGRNGGVGSGFTIIGITRHRQTQAVNVDVRQNRNGHSRTFRLDKIVYQRPKAKR